MTPKQIKVIAEGLGYGKVLMYHGDAECRAHKDRDYAEEFNPYTPENVLAMLVQMKMNDELGLTLEYDHKWWVHNDGHDYGENLLYDTPEEAIIQAYLVMKGEKG